ncbi:hypothetical protein CTI12_AA206060 [Artemisia annua]|uniref:Uncharacterized protein n=1 Tax=Artemisia annua TaxID=35608 RepID=A0A2U1P125_ARTAN|nr:hypothetical protein CTI12_AA206060 [Artemisia annua]
MTSKVYFYEACHNITNQLLHSYHRNHTGDLFTSNISLRMLDVVHLLVYSEDSNDVQENTNRYCEPMLWIGIYIAIASLVCILAMVADLLHGLRNKKLWFPCKFFTLNAASITVITVAMKLPMDLTDEMPRDMEQAAKLGSLAFMCTIMVNLMPSLASMDNKTLLANVIGLSILVITVIVNVIIQINIGIINPISPDYINRYIYFLDCVLVAYIYVAMMILLLIITISSSLTIPTSKEILEFKYQAKNKTLSTDQQQTQNSSVKKLKQHVRRFWVMAETGSPQFVMASSPLSTASGVICVFVLLLQTFFMFEFLYGYHGDAPKILQVSQYKSVYKWSILFIVVTQSIGVVVGNIAPMFRCFSVLSFKLVTKWDRNHFMAFKVEMYWTQKLYEWKENEIPILRSSRRSRNVLYNLKNIALSLCIGFQKVFVVLCKVIWLIPIVVLKFVAYCLYCLKSLKAKILTPPIYSNGEINEDLSRYVLQVNDEMELAQRKLKGITNSMDSFILKAEKEQNSGVLELLKKSTGFDGLEKFDMDQIPHLYSVVLVNSWSLPIVTITCIAISLPRIPMDRVESLVKSVGEGLSYTHLVEEILNISSEYVNIRKATITLWHEVENNCKWLKNSLSKNAFEGKTATEILNWFADKAEEIVIEINKSSDGIRMENNINKELSAANSMYRIARTILHRDQSSTEPLSKKQLFALLNGMIADILSACFTNIPRVITMKCHESVIEKREASVKAAAKLLGKTTKIIEWLETFELPSMDDDKMAYIDEWRLHFNRSIP